MFRLSMLVWAIALALRGGTMRAQVPIERRLPAVSAVAAPSSAAQVLADDQWNALLRQARRGYRPELRIEALGEPLRCDLDEVRSEELFCTEHRVAEPPLMALFHPREGYWIRRAEIRNVRMGGRESSTLLGAAIGVGVGVGVGSISAQSRQSGGQVWGGLLLGGLGGLIGHLAPFKGRVVYRQP